MAEKLVGINTMAETLDVPITWLYARTRLKGPEAIPCVRVGKYVKFKVDEVMDWIQAQQGAQ